MVFRYLFSTLCAVLIIPIFVGAQSGGFRVTIVKDAKSFSFPIFDGGDDQAVIRINRLLQLSELQSLAKDKTNRIFDQSKVKDGSIYGGKVWMWATIYSNRKAILSVGFTESSCGMTCTYWNRYYNFNPGNGDRIALRDLFTSDGFEHFSKKVLNRRSAIYRREVRRKVESKYWESYLDTISCFENDDLADYYIRNGNLVIDGENCLIKGQKFDGLNMHVGFQRNEFHRYLNAYGRSVFGLSRADIAGFRSRELPQLFEGSIDGSLSVAMVLNSEFANGLRGVYAYLQHGAGIGLNGSLIDGRVELTEYVLSHYPEMKVYGSIRRYNENGYISGTLNGPRLEGTWSNTVRSKTLTLTAKAK